MRPLIFLFVLFNLGNGAFASEGFEPSKNPNVFYIKGQTSGATAFLANLPRVGIVLISQVHVLQAVMPKPKLYWNYKSGPFFIALPAGQDSFEIDTTLQSIWKDDALDVVILKAPNELLEKCNCSGFDIAQYHEGPISLIGYPIRGRRTYPITGDLWWQIGELFGYVEQMESSGMIWEENDELLSDADALPGNSGGPVLDINGDVIGIIYRLKSWKGIGYQYLSPHISIISFDAILNKFHRK